MRTLHRLVQPAAQSSGGQLQAAAHVNRRTRRRDVWRKLKAFPRRQWRWFPVLFSIANPSICFIQSMQITWRRLGFLGFMLPMVFWAVAARGWGAGNMKAVRIAMLLAALAVWGVGKWLNSQGLDEDGKHQHLAFNLPLHWPVVPLVGLLITFL